GLSSDTLKASSAVYAYDPAGDHWSKRAALPAGRWLVQTAVVHGDIFAIGRDSGGSPTAELYRYRPDRDRWTTEATAPANLDDGFTAASAGGVIYFAGPLEGGTPHGAVLTYTPSTGTWGSIAPMPRPRYYARIVAGSDNKLYVIGGLDAEGHQTKA